MLLAEYAFTRVLRFADIWMGIPTFIIPKVPAMVCMRAKVKHGHGKCGSHHAHDHGEDQHHAPCSHEVVETDYSLISYSKEGQLIAPELAGHLL